MTLTTTQKLLAIVGSSIVLLSGLYNGITWAGDQRWVTQEALLVKELNELRREHAWLAVKKSEGEATASEKRYIIILESDIKRIETELSK